MNYFAHNNARRPAGASSPFAWLNYLGLRRRDIVPFPDLRLEGGSVSALHRDAAGQALGAERIWYDGRLRYLYTPGARRGLFRAIPQGASRLVVADGPLPVVAAAALDRPAVVTGYAGGWGDIAADAVRRLAAAGIDTVVLAFAATEVGARTTERALEDLVGVPARIEVMQPPAGTTWLAALAAARSARGDA
jgi:hypothetical protein